jgi:ADP-ribose pyrophosphatase YjhB (NUDIX family)
MLKGLEMAIDANFYETLPKKRMAVGALFLDEHDNILIVQPTYRPEWLLPGGTIEENEAPRTACIREVEEELGLQVAITRLLCVDYMSAEPGKNESLQFVFYGGILSPAQIQNIALQESELSAYRFVSCEEATHLLTLNLACRLAPSLLALKQGATAYLENGQDPFTTP